MKKSLFLTSAIMTAVLAVGLSTSTYAWYSTTIGKAASSTTTVSATANNVTGDYNVTPAKLFTVSTTTDSSWTEATTTPVDNKSTFTLGNVIAADYGKAEVNEAEGAQNHWYTAVLVNEKVTLDKTTKGIYALRFTYTIPTSASDVIRSQYSVKVDFKIEVNDATKDVPWVWVFDDNDEATANGTTNLAVTPGDAKDDKVDTKTYTIPETVALHHSYTVWIDGSQVGKGTSLKDIDNVSSAISLTISVEPKTV